MKYAEKLGAFFWDKDEDYKQFKILSICKRKETSLMYYRYVATENLVNECNMEIDEEMAEYTLCSVVLRAKWVSWVEPFKKVDEKKEFKKRKLR